MKRRLKMTCLAGVAVYVVTVQGMAQQPYGTIQADPNPCRIEHERHDCSVSLTWHTEGVERAKVFVTGEGRHPAPERVFSDSRSCDEPGRCMAPWIENDTRYTFQLVDFTHGDRGRVLASVTVSAREGGDRDRDHDGDRDHDRDHDRDRVSGNITAEPNPCRVEPGQHDCVTHIMWQTQGARQVKVFVVAEGRHPAGEREFSTSLSCEGHQCRAPWIEPDTRYTFQLFDFSRGDRGRMLGQVVVTANR